ncbi:hypothetical protein E3N88_02515 [Mikania micrantha]|uniref:Uncharacterized protein n=1 Tax=Mikania micrantha TaxID=192012 RepID=A0A5N6Q467_9ASTR|nr:hypothetical protein E3N88_02515 [Mikania micrantha]
MFNSHHEASDDDELVVPHGRGPNIPAQPPTFENRIWIWVEHDEFNIQDKVSRTIGSILKSMWSGPWQGWKEVPFHHRERMFERFQKYYVWEEECNSLIYSCWETCIKGKFPDLLMRARNKAKALAIQKGIEVRDDLSVIIPFKPHWISQESWTTLVNSLNTNSWKGKSCINIDNRKKAKGGRHTLGSKSFVTVRHNLDKTLKRRASFDEYWLQTHAKKGSRPLDRLEGLSGSVGDGSKEVNDMEGTDHEHNVTWVDSRARESYGRMYGSSKIVDPYVVMTGAPSMPSTESSNPPRRSDEVQRLKEQIEQDKVEKQAMMEKIEENARLYAEMNEKIQLLLKNQQKNISSS